MNLLKAILKKVLPEWIQRKLTGLFYGWYGNYKTWDEALQKTTGYEHKLILEKVIKSTQQVKEGKAAFEKDSVLFYEHEYRYQLLTSLLWVASQNKGKLRVLDFGGSLGSTYFQNRIFFNDLPELKWFVVEQSAFVKTGKEYFEEDKLKFYDTIEQCVKSNEIDVVLFSSVLQYLEKPYNLLDEIIKFNIKYLLIDRTAFIKADNRITIQKVNPAIYKASYPCWFFNEKKLKDYLNPKFELITEFDSPDKANIKSEFKGFLFKRINE